MTIWDKIYIKYQKGGQAWATLNEKIMREFMSYIRRSEFKIHRVLDIGCGTGKYLEYLTARGFIPAGIDSSPTAVKMTRKFLGLKKAEIKCAEMYQYKIPANQYDLIISIATLQHGKKSQVKKLIGRIYRGLIKSGHIYITLPSDKAAHLWATFKKYKIIAPGTYAPMAGPEKGLPHSFFTRAEIMTIFKKFKNIKLSLDKKYRWLITGSK